jgi:thioredoxin reductase
MSRSPAKYDVDVVVIGNGPAGLTAAIRARWVKGYSVLPCSVGIVGAGPAGGLLPWGGAILTGPGWAFKGKELLNKLMADVQRLSIPIYPGEATAVRREGSFLVIEGKRHSALRALSVVVATGLRATGNEADYYQKGVYATFKSYGYLSKLIADAANDCDGQGLLVVGNERTELLSPLFHETAQRAGGLTFLLDAEANWRPPADFPGAVVKGRLADVAKNKTRSSRRGVFAARATGTDGSSTHIRCGAILIDYNAFEQKPSLPISSKEDKAEDNLLNLLKREERGFIVVDRWMRTSEPGIFAAGDITGRYSSTVMAMGDGVCAGFGAYRWAFRTKFGDEPRLFAYAATRALITPETSDLPGLPDHCSPKLLSGELRFKQMAARSGIALKGHTELFDGSNSLQQVGRRLGCDLEVLRKLVADACSSRLMTVHAVTPALGNGKPAIEKRSV